MTKSNSNEPSPYDWYSRQELVDEIVELASAPGVTYPTGGWGVVTSIEALQAKLNGLPVETLVAILNASRHPSFDVSAVLRWFRSHQLSLMNAALYFDILSGTNVDAVNYDRVTEIAYRLTANNETPAALLIDSPEYATAMMRLAASLFGVVSSDFDDELHPSLQEMVSQSPDSAHMILEFISQRGLTRLSDIDLETFKGTLATASPSLRSGVL
jgi:hypothetical protein